MYLRARASVCSINPFKNRKHGLTCTFRTSCYSTRLSWTLVLTWVNPFVQDKKKSSGGGGGGMGKREKKDGTVLFRERIGILAITFALKNHSRPVLTVITKVKTFLLNLQYRSRWRSDYFIG